MIKFDYRCVECKKLMASSNKPLEVAATCSNCESKFTKRMTLRRKEKLNVDYDCNQKKKLEKRLAAKMRRQREK